MIRPRTKVPVVAPTPAAPDPARPHRTVRPRRRARNESVGTNGGYRARRPHPIVRIIAGRSANDGRSRRSAHLDMTTQNGRAFNEWLRAQLKAKKMSQRQLAQQSGVDHSTISRLIRGDRMPSLGTATKLARGLRELRDDADTPQYLGLVASGSMNPTARVEYALRADDLLSEPQVRQIMEYYLAVRMRRYGRSLQAQEASTAPERPTDHRWPGRRHPSARWAPPPASRPSGSASDPSARSPGRGAGNRGVISILLGTTRIALHHPGLRGQRTPASGAPAFTFCPGSVPAARPDDPVARRCRGAASSSRRSA